MAEEPLQVVVGARQVGHAIALEQTGPIAGGHLEKVVDGPRERAGLVAPVGHRGDPAFEAALDLPGLPSLCVGQDARDLVDRAIGPLNVRPEGVRPLKALPEQPAQPLQWARQSPFSATRSRLAATAANRSRSFKPEAASGGRPSSVSALRTAAQ